jgi:Na+/H+ antiporter NhaD/arsenite permease-like protein
LPWTNISFSSLCSELDTDKKVSAPSLTSEQMAPRGQLVFAVGIGALLFVPVFKSLTGLPPYLGMLLGLGTLWLLTDAIHYGETGRQKLKVPQALSRIDTQGVLFFLGILLSVGRWVLLELLATPICSSTFRSLSTHATKVDGPYLVAFFCLLPYTTQIG